jgi:hypothetical protein
MPTSKPIREKTWTFGGCDYERTIPRREELSSSTAILEIVLPFEEALKFSLAVDECVRRLNRYNRATEAGKTSALKVAIRFKRGRVTVHEARLQKD